MVGAPLNSQRLDQAALSDAFQEDPPQSQEVSLCFPQTWNPRLPFQVSCQCLPVK